MSDSLQPIAEAAYKGLDKEDAIWQARQDGWKVRIVSEDGTDYVVTADFSPERLNFDIENGKVTGVEIG